jgi:iron complex outermembrane receptor protein
VQRHVVVPQENEGAGGERAKGHVNGYLASRSATASKTDTPLLETPQSISVVTQDQIASQGVQSVHDALRYTPGVSLESFGANTFFDFLKLDAQAEVRRLSRRASARRALATCITSPASCR